MNTSKPIAEGLRLSGCFVLILWLAAGCATRKPAHSNAIFFPAPPDEPRIQYLMSYGSEKDLGEPGALSKFIVGEQREHRPIWKPYGVTIRAGKIYVCDTQAGNISVADLAKKSLHYIKPDGQAAMKLPINVAVDEDGTIFTTDTGRNQVMVYNQAGDLIDAMGKKGEMRPCGVALAGDRLYVTDLTNHCVRVYAKSNRQLLFTIPRTPDEKSKLFIPTNVAVDPNGRICVSDSAGFAIKVYDAEGNHLRTIGDLGVSPGQFALPKGIGVDHEGRIYVVDAAAPVVQLFDAEGRLLMWFGEPKSSGPAGLYLPAGLSIDYENTAYFEKFVAPGYKLEYLILLTNQVGPNKVSVYGFVKKA